MLSNAYKNKNMYNMILPTKPVPYQYLQELVNDNFTIYTRSAYVNNDVRRGPGAQQIYPGILQE